MMGRNDEKAEALALGSEVRGGSRSSLSLLSELIPTKGGAVDHTLSFLFSTIEK